MIWPDVPCVVVAGEPVPWERTDGARRKRPNTAVYQDAVAWTWVAQGGLRAGGARVSVAIDVYRSTHKRCDVDNLAKTVLDALNGLAWDDDCQVDELRVRRSVDRVAPRCEVQVVVIEEAR